MSFMCVKQESEDTKSLNPLWNDNKRGRNKKFKRRKHRF